MRIGLVAPPWIPVPPPSYGGTESVIANLAAELTARGHDVALFTVGSSTSPATRGHFFADAVEPLGQSVTEAAHVLAAYEALADMDVIHDHTILGPLVSARAGRARPPVVTTNHGPFTAVTRPLFREIARTASVVAISNDQASRAGDVPIAAVIHHGVDTSTYRPRPGVGEHVAFVGRMSPDKGVDRAVRIARAAGRPLQLYSKMREPEEVAYFETCVAPLLGADPQPPRERPLEERLAAVGTAAALLNPIAWDEPFGLVMAEALAMGTPVVASPRGAAPEIVTDGVTGFLCETEEQAVRALERISLIDRAVCRDEAVRRFSVARMAADYERLFESVCSSGVPLQRPAAPEAQQLANRRRIRVAP